MADTLEPSRLRKILFTPIYVRRSRIDWRKQLAASNLPTAIQDTIRFIVQRARLWPRERVDVAEELIAHFADGLASGANAEDLVRDFGDARRAAKLIRSAKRRNRSYLWHILKWLGRAYLLLVFLYCLVALRFVLSRPTIKVDYVGQMNAAIEATPISDRAWPVYRQAMLSLGIAESRKDTALDERMDDPADASRGYRTLLEATPADPQWPKLTAWLDAHAAGLAALRTNVTKQHMGFVYGDNGSIRDPEMGWNFTSNATSEVDSPMISVLMPNLNGMRSLASLLAADVRYAGTQGDSVRASADLDSMIALGRHQDAPILVTRLVGLGIYGLTFDTLQATLAEHPEIFSDDQLISLAHRTATIGGENASSLIDLSSERAFFHDIIQRTYTDDGHGDGVMTREGAKYIATLVPASANNRPNNYRQSALVAMQFGALAVTKSRHDLEAEYDRLITVLEGNMARPGREVVAENRDQIVSDRMDEIVASPIDSVRLLPIPMLTPSLGRLQLTAERLLASRDATVTALAIELYKRRHGAFPMTLDELVPTLLPCVLDDRIAGGPMHYRLIDGKPVLYSLGVDRDDDGGKPPTSEHGGVANFQAAQWRITSTDNERERRLDRHNGDWILYDGRPDAPTRD